MTLWAGAQGLEPWDPGAAHVSAAVLSDALEEELGCGLPTGPKGAVLSDGGSGGGTGSKEATGTIHPTHVKATTSSQ